MMIITTKRIELSEAMEVAADPDAHGLGKCQVALDTLDWHIHKLEEDETGRVPHHIWLAAESLRTYPPLLAALAM